MASTVQTYIAEILQNPLEVLVIDIFDAVPETDEALDLVDT